MSAGPWRMPPPRSSSTLPAVSLPVAWPSQPSPPDAENSASVHRAHSDLRDCVWVKYNRRASTAFCLAIALPDDGGHSRVMPLKTVCPNSEGIGEEFDSNGSRGVGDASKNQGVCRACNSLTLRSQVV